MSTSRDHLWIWMDLSGSCNLSCRDCYTKHAHTPSLLSATSFELVLRKLASTSFTVEKLHLNWRGEPLTNKRFGDFLRIRKSVFPDAPLEFHTNGLLLTPALCAEIVELTLEGDLAYVSIDGGSKPLHEANRGQETWDTTLLGLQRLLDAKEAAFVPTLSVGIYEISYGRNVAYDRTLVALSRRCDMWTRVSPIDTHGNESPFDTQEIPHGPCFWAGNSMCITAKGDVHICMLSFDASGIIGNILTEDAQTIFDRGRSFRAALTARGRHSIPHCSNCRKSEGTIDL